MSDQIPKNTDLQPIPIAGDALIAQPVTIEPDQVVPAVIPARPRVWIVFVMYFLTYVVSVVVGVIILFLIMPASSRTKASPHHFGDAAKFLDQSPRFMLFLLVETMVVIFIFAMVGAALSPIPWRERLRFKPAGMAPRRLLASAIGAIAMGFVFTTLSALELLPSSSAIDSLGDMLSKLSGLGVVAYVVTVGLLPGLSEELMFRGYIQTRLSARWGCRWSIFLTAFLFALFHMDIGQSFFTFALGLYLGALTERTGSIVPAIICHAANNTFGSIMDAAGIQITGSFWSWPLLVITAIILYMCIRYVRRPEVIASPVSEPPQPFTP